VSAREKLRFKVDENSAAEFVEMLCAAGHDAEHALEETLEGAPDSKIAEAASSENRAIVTLDLDFADIRRFPPRKRSDLIVLRPDSQQRTRLIQVSIACFNRSLRSTLPLDGGSPPSRAFASANTW